MSLGALQRDFVQWLRGDVEDAPPPFGPAAAAGLAIYRNNYRAALVACLEHGFARTGQWLGGAAFREACVTHVRRVPPGSWTLDAYGRDFPATLARLHPLDPEVAELATLELALADAFVAADAEIRLPRDGRAIDWDRAVLAFHPSIGLHPLTTNAPAIWSALDADIMPPPAARLPEPATLLVWRRGEVSRFETIDRAEARALLACRSGLTFGALCMETVRELGEEAGVATAGAWLGRWIAQALIVGVRD